jgi:PAS domain S-box-containing protein
MIGHRKNVSVPLMVTAMWLCGAAGQPAEPAPLPIRSACEDSYPPFCAVDAAGRAEGFSVELMRAALLAMGRDVTFRGGPWPEVKGWLEKGEVEALPLVGRTPERENAFDFTVPYLTMHGAIVVRRETKNIRTLADLRGRTIAVMKDDNVEEFLRRTNRGIVIRTTATFEDALRELSQGRHDAVVVQKLVGLRLIAQLQLANLRIIDPPISEFRQDFCFAVREGDRDTLALLNEGLALVIADGTYRRLHVKWFAALELPSNRKLVIGGDGNYPPFEFLDAKERPTGYNSELTRALARELNLDIEIRLGSWEYMVRALETGEVDALQGMLYSAERDQKFDFSPPHRVISCVAVTRQEDGPPPNTVAELKGRRIVVQDGDIMHAFALEHGLGERLVLVPAQEDALREVAEGRQDCALVARITAFYWIEQRQWTNLSVGQSPLASHEYGYAVASGNLALLADIGEGLKMLDENGEYRRISDKWMRVYEPPPPVSLTYLTAIVEFLLALVGISLLWSWSLRRQVARRTAELRQSEERLRAVLDATPFPIALVDNQDDKIHFWSRSAQEVFGHTAPTAAEWYKIAYPDPEYRREVLRRWRPAVEQARQSNQAVNAGEYQVSGPNGLVRTCELYAAFVADHLVVTFNDITNRKRAEEMLVREKQFIDNAINSLPGIFYVFDEKGQFLRWNRNFEIISGYSPEEIGQLSPLDLFSGQDKVLVGDAIQRVFAGGAVEVEASLVVKDGRAMPYYFTGLRFLSDNHTYCVGMGIDITERKRAEESLRAQAAELSVQNDELARFNRVVVGRELRMIELKQEVNVLAKRLGDTPPYRTFTGDDASLPSGEATT